MKTMKSVFIKTTCMLILVLASNSFSLTQAQSKSYSASADESKGDIRFVDARDGMLVFELNLKNLPAKGSRIQIKDEEGNVIFEESIRTETYNVRYRIERTGISRIAFEVSNKKILMNKTFSINSHIEEKIEVAKL